MISDHAVEFGGLPVRDFPVDGGTIDEPDRHGYRLRLEYESEVAFGDYFTRFLEDPNAERVRVLLMGAWSDEMWNESTSVLVESLVSAAPQLASLEALFLVDTVPPEQDIAYTTQCDISPLLDAFPRLQFLTIRGGIGLSLGRAAHDRLTHLVIESGGLPRTVLREVATCRLPDLEHLELYLGTSYYGWDGTMDDVAAVLKADLPKLRYLGLRDSDVADAVAAVVAKSPILERIEELDLSLGTLGDEGGRALLASPGVRTLDRLDLHHHYLSKAVAEELRTLPPTVNLDDAQGDAPNEHRYVAVSE